MLKSNRDSHTRLAARAAMTKTEEAIWIAAYVSIMDRAIKPHPSIHPQVSLVDQAIAAAEHADEVVHLAPISSLPSRDLVSRRFLGGET